MHRANRRILFSVVSSCSLFLAAGPASAALRAREDIGGKRADPFADEIKEQRVEGEAKKEGAVVREARVLRELDGNQAAYRNVERFPALVPTIEGHIDTPTVQRPAEVTLLLDGSNSMLNPYGGQPGENRIQALEKVANGTLRQLIDDNLDGEELREKATVRVGVFQGDRLNPVLGTLDQGVSLGQLAEKAIDVAGDPGWISGLRTAKGTPMRTAFGTIADHVGNVDGRLSLLVVVSDGRPHDGDPLPEIARWAKMVKEHGGQPLATQIYISSDAAAHQALFPDDAEMDRLVASKQIDDHGVELYKAASIVPPKLATKLGLKGEGHRLFGYNVHEVKEASRIFAAGSSMMVR